MLGIFVRNDLNWTKEKRCHILNLCVMSSLNYGLCVSVDDVVEYKHGEKSAQTLHSAGFQNIVFHNYNR